MSFKLNEKEISALAKKIADKKNAEIKSKKQAFAKAKMPEAKKIKGILDSLPETVLAWLYSTRYGRGSVTVASIANTLAKANEDDYCEIKSEKFESDVILAAHDAKDMSTLCKKLGI